MLPKHPEKSRATDVNVLLKKSRMSSSGFVSPDKCLYGSQGLQSVGHKRTWTGTNRTEQFICDKNTCGLFLVAKNH